LVLSAWLSRIPCVLPLGELDKYLHVFLWFYVINEQYQENTQGISQNQRNMCRYLSNSPSGNTQGIRDNHADRTNCVFPPFNPPHKAQAIPIRSHLSLNVIFWSKIQRGGSKRQSEYSWAKYAALPVVWGRQLHVSRMFQTFGSVGLVHCRVFVQPCTLHLYSNETNLSYL